MPRSREQERQYRREYRARQRGEDRPVGPTNVPQRPSGPSATSRVLEELDGLSGAESRPSDVAAALAMARLLDDAAAAPQHPAAARVLREVMEGLRSVATARPVGRLAELRAARQIPAPTKRRTSVNGHD